MSGVFMGLTAGAWVALGVSAAGTAYSIGQSTSRANEASNRAGDAARQREGMIRDARDRLEASNRYEELAVNKKMYEDQLDSLMAAQAGQNLGMADQRQTTAGAARQQAILQKGLGAATDSQIKQEQAIAKMVADQDVKIDQQLASIDIGEANQLAKDEQAFRKQEQSYRAAAADATGQLLTDVVSPLVSYGTSQLDSHLAGKSLAKAGGADAIGPAGLAPFAPKADDLGLDMAAINLANPELGSALTSNPAFMRQLGGLYEGGVTPDDQAVISLFDDALDYETIRAISGGFQ